MDPHGSSRCIHILSSTESSQCVWRKPATRAEVVGRLAREGRREPACRRRTRKQGRVEWPETHAEVRARSEDGQLLEREVRRRQGRPAAGARGEAAAAAGRRRRRPPVLWEEEEEARATAGKWRRRGGPPLEGGGQAAEEAAGLGNARKRPATG